MDDKWANEVDSALKELARLEFVEKQNHEQVMKRVKAMVADDVYSDIQEFVLESGHTSNFDIIDKPVGDKQSESDYEFKYSYVKQTCNGGYSGDDYAGTVCIPLGDEVYLMFYYSM